MRMGFVLLAYDPNRDVSVPIARVIIPKDDYEFFRHAVWNGLRGYELMVYCVVGKLREHIPDILAPYDSGGWEFHLNSEGVAAVMGLDLNQLPTVEFKPTTHN
jgi:hypothetical protein